MRIFLTRGVVRFARRQRIADTSIGEAIERAERGTIDADLGGGLIKQRVARPGQGRSGGYRMIVAYRAAGRGVFLYAFAKSERDNIDDDEGFRFLIAPIGFRDFALSSSQLGLMR